MKVYNLPELDLDGMAQPSKSGEWLRLRSLGTLATDLSIDRQQLSVFDIKSVPDAWAQVQLFSQALLDRNHEAYESVRAQWRGILALFALERDYEQSYALDVQITTLSERPDRRFRRVLAELAPSGTLDPAVSWDRLGVVLLRNKGARAAPATAIALISPTTLVAGGRLVRRLVHADVPWLSSGIGDPLDANLSADRYAILAQYLENVLRSLRKSAAPETARDLFDDLTRELEDYRRACLTHVEGAPALRAVRLPHSWPHSFFGMLGDTAAVDQGSIKGQSHVRVVARREGSDLFKSIVLADPAIAVSMSTEPRSIRVFEQFTLADIQRKAQLDAARKQAAADGHLLLTVDDLLTKQLVRLDGGANVAAHRNGADKALLPLTPLALLLFDADQLADAVSLRDKGGAFEFELRLPLTDGGNGHVQHRIIRRYEGADILQLEAPADIALWPNFRSPNWRWNFLRFQYNPGSELRTRFAASHALIAALAQKESLATARANAVAMWADTHAIDRQLAASPLTRLFDSSGRVVLERMEFAQTTSLVGEQHLLPMGAEAVFFSYGEGGPSSAVPVGCALVALEAPSAMDVPADIAIDFGTTNTVAYRLKASAREEVDFRSRVVFPIGAGSGEAERRKKVASAYTDFFPLDEQPTPFPTIVKRRRFGGQAGASFSRQQADLASHGAESSIFFMPASIRDNDPTSIADWITKGELASNIKWAESAEERELTVRFLLQLMMMSAAELAAEGVNPSRVRWRFSYPQAFSPRQRESLRKAISRAWSVLGGGPDDSVPPPEGILELRTESAAAIAYFTGDDEQEAKAVNPLVIMLDIGGGTTDMAIWHNKSLAWRGSVKIAGGTFFTNYVVANPEIIESLSKPIGDQLAAGFGADREAPRQFVELFVNTPKFAGDFDRAYPLRNDEPSWAGLRHCASIAVGGLLHYLGIVLKGLVEEDIVPEEAAKSFTVAFGGRGSNFLRQLENTGELQDLCKLLVASAGYDTAAAQISVRFSKMPKHEVARGLLRPSPDGDTPSSKHQPVGEVVTLRLNRQIEPSADVSAIPSGAEVREVALTELNRFLRHLSAHAGISVNLTGTDAAASAEAFIRTRVKADLVNYRPPAEGDLASDTQTIEPPFITGLHHLVALLSRPAPERVTRLKVKGR